MEMLTNTVVPCAFHDFRDTGKSQCMLFVDENRTVTSVFFKMFSNQTGFFFLVVVVFCCCCWFVSLFVGLVWFRLGLFTG